MTIAISIVLIVMAIALIVFVLFQQGKERGMSSAISGGNAETYYGKGKTKSKDKLLSRLTLIFSILFCLIVLVLYITQNVSNFNDYLDKNWDKDTATTTTTAK